MKVTAKGIQRTIKISTTSSWTDVEIINDIIKKIPNYGDTKSNSIDEIEVTITLRRGKPTCPHSDEINPEVCIYDCRECPITKIGR